MRIEIANISFENFKGFDNKSFELFPGRNILIGDNETGKTTFADGPTWLIDGKDSLGKERFDIKPLDKNGEPLHNLTYSVAAQFRRDDELVPAISRSVTEVWTKPRKQRTKQLTSHKTAFIIGSDVDVSPTNFQSFARENLRGDDYKLVSDPRYFPSLPTQKRRDLLTKIADLTEEEKDKIISSIGDLKTKIGKRSVEQVKKIYQQRKKVLDDSDTIDGNNFQSIPAVLKNIKERLDNFGAIQDKKLLEKAVVDAENLIEKYQTEIDRIKTGDSGVNEKLKELNQRLTTITNEFYAEKGKQTRFESARQEDIRNLQNDISTLNQEISDHLDLVRDLLKQWETVKVEQLVQDKLCFNCKQPLPDGMLTSIDDFNEHKSTRLSEIEKRGQDAENEIKALREKVKEKEKELEELQKIEPYEIVKQDKSPEMSKIQAEINHLIEKKGEVEIPDELTHNLEMAKNELKRAQESVSEFTVLEDQRKEYEEKTAIHKKLAAEYNLISEFFDLAEKYEHKIAEETEKKVNKLFKIAKFRMFRKQMNGELDFRCDILGPNGDDFYTNVNSGTKIKIGLDIIKVLQKHLDLYVPIIIDNAESVSNIPEMDCQVIELYKCSWEKSLEKAFAVDWFGNYISEKTFQSLDGTLAGKCQLLVDQEA